MPTPIAQTRQIKQQGHVISAEGVPDVDFDSINPVPTGLPLFDGNISSDD